MTPSPTIWLASYPKSGNTWMRTLLREYFRHSAKAQPFETSDSSTYWYQTCSPKPLELLSIEDLALLRSTAMMHMNVFIEGYGSKYPATVVKTHNVCARYAEIPIFTPFWMTKAVYIYRDPRDVLPSFAHHIGDSLEDAAEKMNSPVATIGHAPRIPSTLSTWSNHVESWVGYTKVPVLTMSYEQMHADAGEQLTRVLEFYELPIDERSVRKAVRASTFDKLQRQEEEEGFSEKSHKNDRFFRRGVVGSHKDEVPPELVKRIETDHGRVMEALGYV